MGKNISPNFVTLYSNLMVFFVCGITFFISPLICLLLSIFFFLFQKKESWITSGFLAVSVTYPILNYVPLPSDDASRIFHVFEALRGIQFENLLVWLKAWAPDYLNYPIFTGFMYLFAQFCKPAVLSFFTAAVSVAVLTFIVEKFTNKFEIPTLIKFLLIIACIFWLNILELISGMRFTLASVLVVLLVLEIFIFRSNRSNITWVWFLIPLMIHPGVILIVLPVLAWWFVRFFKNSLIKAVTGVCFTVMLALFIGSQITGFGYINMLLSRYTSYKSVTYGYLLQPQRVLHVVIGFCIISFSLLMLRNLRVSSENKSNYQLNTLESILKYYVVVFAFCAFEMNFESRMMVAIPILSILAISSISSKKVVDIFKRNTYVVILTLLLVILSGVLYNIGISRIDIETINWYLPFASF